MINEQMENSEGFQIRVDYVCAALEKDKEKRPFVEFLGGNIVSGDPFIRSTKANGEQGVEVDTSALVNELTAHGSKYRGQSKELCAHFVLSLATGETMRKLDLLEAARDYMKALGYSKGSKWFSVVHYDTDNIHVHIVACRAQMIHSEMSPNGKPRPPQFSIVSDSHSYRKGWEACREIEKKFGLQVVANPDECFGKNNDIFENGKDQAKIIRGIIGDVWKSGKPKTFSDLVVRLEKRGVLIQIKTESDGLLIKGINYKIDREDGKWISGSKIKATRLTFDKLIEKEGINYDPKRDNELLGLPLDAYTLVKNTAPTPANTTPVGATDALMRVYVKLPSKSKRLDKYIKNRGRIYSKYSANSDFFLGFNAHVNLSLRKKTRAEVEAEIESGRILKMMNALMKMMRDALSDLFYEMQVHVQFAEASDHDLTEPALRLNIPAGVGQRPFDLHEQMGDAVDAQVEKQMRYLASVLEPESEALELSQ